MTEDKAQLVAKAFLQLLHDGVSLAAPGTLVVSVFDKSGGRYRPSLDVVSSAYGEAKHY